MSKPTKQAETSEEEYQSDAEGDENTALQPAQQQQQQQLQRQQQQQLQQQQQQQMAPPPRAEGYRTSAIRESRIKSRPEPKSTASDSALKIKIELDLEVEVDLYARVKGDITIGLM